MSLANFGVRKPVPVNLLMVAMIVAGLYSAATLRREFFPETDPDSATVTLPYPGAIPEEIEDTLAIKVEDALWDLDEVDELTTTISEGGGGITVKFHEWVDVDEGLDEVERTVDGLLDLPDESETIQAILFEPRLPVVRVNLFGDVDEQVLKAAMRAVRDDLMSLQGIGELIIEGVRDYEIRVDVDFPELMRHGLSLPQVADTISAWMIDVPGGTVKGSSGNSSMRTLGVAPEASEIGEIILKADPEGGALRVRDIATVRETFVDEQIIHRFNGQPSAGLVVYALTGQDIVQMAESVRAYVAGRNNKPLPWSARDALLGSHRQEAWELGHSSPRPLAPGISIDLNADFARFVEGRLELLVRNAAYGAILVFGTLLLVLNWRVAMWVGMGLATALLGTLVLMAAFDVTLNLLTMFGLIVVLGLLVDDAIVVAENIQTRHDHGEPSLVAAVKGTDQVAWPVVATVMTSVVAFLPLLFIRGQMGDLMGALPIIVACALMMSLVESLLILPSHMGHSLAKRDQGQARIDTDTQHAHKTLHFIHRLEHQRDAWIENKVIPFYRGILARSLKYRYISAAIAIAVLLGSVGLVVGGRVAYVFLPKMDAENLIVDVRLPIGAPVERTQNVVQRIEQAARQQDEIRSVGSVIGQRSNIDSGAPEAFSTHVAQLYIELHPVEQRDRQSSEVIVSIRDALQGHLDDVDRINFTEMSGGPGGPDITIRARGDDPQQLEAAAIDLQSLLREYAGVNDIADDNDLGQLERRIVLRPGAAALGFTSAQVATQVRGFLFGLDAHVFADRQEDIDVRVRVDEQTRRNLSAIENAWVTSPTGEAVPLTEIADIVESTTYATIRRIDRQRAVTVTATTAPGYPPESIVEQISKPSKDNPNAPAPIDAIRAKYPGLSIEFAGRQEQMADAFGSLPTGMMAALLMIYIILAWLFSSYLLPLVVMSVIPFAIIGAVWGHLLLGYEITFLSQIGFVALSGIVVNDSLILIIFYREQREQGRSVHDSLLAAGCARLRPIVLTTVTTVLGLMPLILEQSFQAKFLIPMAISIAMGLVAATALILLVLPCFVLIFDDLKAASHFLWFGRPRERDTLPTKSLANA